LVETLTESFCERCGTRYEFKAPTRLNPLRKTRGFIGGLKNYLTSQDDLGDAMSDAMRSEEDQLASAQLEAFHESFNFCIDCRQYTCLNCWNDNAGRCRSCAPIAGTDDLAERLVASFETGTTATTTPADEPAAMAEDELQRRLGMTAWPTTDLPVAPPTNGHAPDAWPASDAGETLFGGPDRIPSPTEFERPLAEPDRIPSPTEFERPLAEPEPAPEPMVAEVKPEPEPAPEPMVAHVEPEPEPAPEPMVAEVEPEPEPEPEPMLAEVEPEPEPEPIVAEVDAEPEVGSIEHPPLRVVSWEDDAPVVELEPVVAEVEPEVEPEPVVAEVEPEPEPEPVVAEVEPEPVVAEVEPEVDPEPVVAEVEPEVDPEPVVAEVEPEVEPQPEPPRLRIAPISETILRFPTPVAPPPVPEEDAPGAEAAAVEESPEVAARRAQLDLLGLGDPGEGPVMPERPAVLPYRSRGAALVASARQGGFWEASAREVAGATTQIGVQNCGQCGLSLSASARFCRRCGTRQAQSA